MNTMFVIFAANSGALDVLRISEGGAPASRPVATDDGQSPAESAMGVAAALQELGYRSQPVVLALPSAWCLPATISTLGLPLRTGRREAMAYELDERLPIAAEDFVADFIEGDADRALGVAVRVSTIEPLLESLQVHGVTVDSVCPAAMLAASVVPMAGDGPADVVVLGDDAGSLDVLLRHDVRIVAWYVLPDDPDDVVDHLDHHASDFSSGFAVSAIGVAQSTVDVMSDPTNGGHKVHRLDGDLRSITTAGAARVLAGKIGVADLCRDPRLATARPYRALRRPLAFAVGAGVLAVWCIAGAFLIRGHAYGAATDRAMAEVARQYVEAFPDRLPAGALAQKLASEERRLRGAIADDGRSAPPSALLVLHQTLSRLPRDVTYRIDDLRVVDGRVTAAGSAPTHGDADAVAARLRAGGELEVDPPRTEQTDGGDSVSFELSAAFRELPVRTSGRTR